MSKTILNGERAITIEAIKSPLPINIGAHYLPLTSIEEGTFQSHWCNVCDRSSGSCPIWAKYILHNWPISEFIYSKKGPVCTAFTQKGVDAQLPEFGTQKGHPDHGFWMGK